MFFHNTLRCLLHCGHDFYIIPSSLKRTIIETKESVFDSNLDSKLLEITVRFVNKPYLRHVHPDLDFRPVTFQEKHWLLLIAVTGRLTMYCPTCFFHIGITVYLFDSFSLGSSTYGYLIDVLLDLGCNNSALARGKKWRGDCWWKGGTESV